MQWLAKQALVEPETHPPSMRIAEAVQMVTFVYFGALAWLFTMPRASRLFLTAQSGLGVAAMVALARAPSTALWSVVRDWLPAFLILVTYWSSGLFVSSYDGRLERILLDWDRRLWLPPPRSRLWSTALELAYLLCYVLVPMGLGALYLSRLGRRADDYWAIVLPAAYVCYGAVPFLPARPPRLVDEAMPAPPPTPLRRFNLAILAKASIGANTFPSAHVAASGAAALAMLDFVPSVGPLFLLVALGIAVGAVYGRYHYAADSIAGAALALASYAVFYFLH